MEILKRKSNKYLLCKSTISMGRSAEGFKQCAPPYISVKLIAEDSEPLLLVVEREPKLELELTDNVEADNVLN